MQPYRGFCVIISLLFALTHLAYSADITFRIVPTTLVPNPAALPPSTRLTLQRLNNTLVAPITRSNTFVFRNVSPGSYLGTVQCRDYAFGPLRVDITPSTGQEDTHNVDVWQTFWANEWGNKGERRGGGIWSPESREPVVTDIMAERVKEYYQDRMGCA